LGSSKHVNALMLVAQLLTVLHSAFPPLYNFSNANTPLPTLEREPKLQTRTASSPVPPNGCGPSKIVATSFPERRTCRTYPRRELSDGEVAKDYTRCTDCRRNEAALKATLALERTKKSGRKKDKDGVNAKQQSTMKGVSEASNSGAARKGKTGRLYRLLSFERSIQSALRMGVVQPGYIGIAHWCMLQE
jgi:hypothetical protein